jgi:hypothetical protein
MKAARKGRRKPEGSENTQAFFDPSGKRKGPWSLLSPRGSGDPEGLRAEAKGLYPVFRCHGQQLQCDAYRAVRQARVMRQVTRPSPRFAFASFQASFWKNSGFMVRIRAISPSNH